MPTLDANPQWLRANVAAADETVGVDREKKMILGYVVAQEGPFREPNPRGEFDETSLRQIVKLMKGKSNGTKVRFEHPSASGDALGKYLGRSINPRMDKVSVMRDGQSVELKAVRADLKLSDTAFEKNPNGNIGEYVLSLAEEDSSSFGSSLVLKTDEEFRMDNHNKRRLGADGEPLPPLWRPTAIHASDLVDEGAAVDQLLSAGINVDGLPDAILHRGAELLDKQFPGQTREVVEARCLSWLNRYLDVRFGQKPPIPGADLFKPAYEEKPTEPAAELKPEPPKQAIPIPEANGHLRPVPTAEELAAIGGVSPGDRVQFIMEDPDNAYAWTETAIVRQTRSDGPIGIPGTEIESTGTVDNPCALVQCWPLDQDEPADEWYLVGFDRLTKVVQVGEDPGSFSSMMSKEDEEFAKVLKQRGEEIAAVTTELEADLADEDAFGLELEMRKRELQEES